MAPPFVREGVSVVTEDKKNDEFLTNDAGVHVHPNGGGRVFQVEGNDVSAFSGVDPEYMNYASVASQPFETDSEKDVRLEHERKVRVANGEEAPRDDDLVLFEGATMTYAEAKKAAGESGTDAEDASVITDGAPVTNAAATPPASVDRSEQQAQQNKAAESK